MRLNVHTIFVARENILFLEEWIEYHLSIGFDKIYMYDNSASIGRDGSTKDMNKYEIDFKHVTREISDEDLYHLVEDIVERFKEFVYYQKWEPIDPQGQIVYGQNESILDYNRRFAEESDWTAYIDMDEFIYSKIDLKQILNECEINGIGHISLLQKKFDDRYNNINRPVTSIVECVGDIDTSNWAPKCLIKNANFKFTAKDNWNIHYLPTENCLRLTASSEVLRFNHYNVNKAQLIWMKMFYNTNLDFELNEECRELKDIFHYNCRLILKNMPQSKF